MTWLVKVFTLDSGEAFTVRKVRVASLGTARINGELRIIKRLEVKTTDGESIEGPAEVFLELLKQNESEGI